MDALMTADRLVSACSDDGFDAGVLVVAELEPVAGPGAPVKPAVYADRQYQEDRRWVRANDELVERAVVVIDNVPSQANRLEAALLSLRDRLGLPDLVLDLSTVGDLPPHLPRRLSCFEFPHRNADAYLRDAELDATPFPKTEVGRAIFSATADDAEALLAWMPQSLLFGFWQTHLGKKRSQAKLARSWVSEIVGVEPATTDTRTLGVKGDPLNLSIDDAVSVDDLDTATWDLTGGAKAGKRRAGDSLAEIGHGQVPVTSSDAAPAAVSFRHIEQRSSVTFAGLRRVSFGSPERNAAGRALLVALGLVAHVAAFGRAFSLRSGCDLRATGTTWTWLGSGADTTIPALAIDDAVALFRDCVEVAEATDLPVGDRWQTPILLTPQPKLASVIAKSWPSMSEDSAGAGH
jgi:CRISPR-associated protein Csb1